MLIFSQLASNVTAVAAWQQMAAAAVAAWQQMAVARRVAGDTVWQQVQHLILSDRKHQKCRPQHQLMVQFSAVSSVLNKVFLKLFHEPNVNFQRSSHQVCSTQFLDGFTLIGV